MPVKITNLTAFDWQAIGLTEAPTVVPHPTEYYGDDAGCARIHAHYAGELPADQLHPEEREFLRVEVEKRKSEACEAARALFARRVPRRYANVQPDPRTADWVKRVTTSPNEAPGLIIVGPTGTGKTHLAWATLRAITESGTPISPRWRAITAVDLYASLRPGGVDDPDAELRSLAGTRLLFIDDLAAAKASEWTEEITYRLINRRYEQCLPTLITSNVPPSAMRDNLGERVASRLVEMCDRIILKGDDRRRGA